MCVYYICYGVPRSPLHVFVFVVHFDISAPVAVGDVFPPPFGHSLNVAQYNRSIFTARTATNAARFPP